MKNNYAYVVLCYCDDNWHSFIWGVYGTEDKADKAIESLERLGYRGTKQLQVVN